MLPDSALPRMQADEMRLLNGASTGGASGMPGSPASASDTLGASAAARLGARAADTTSNSASTAGTTSPGAADFDRTYITQQVAAHQRTLALVDAAIARGSNAAMRTMLQSDVRPAVASHLAMAQQIQQQLGTR
jgi:hypothetical protein